MKLSKIEKKAQNLKHLIRKNVFFTVMTTKIIK